MKAKIIIITLPLALTLAACGGSGSGDLVRSQPDSSLPDSGSITDGSSTDVAPDPDLGAANGGTQPAEADATADLLTTKSFDFKTQWEMAVDFDIGDAKAKDGFLSICSEFEFDGESAYDVNYDKCSIRSKISNGVFNSSVNVTNDIDGLLAVVWFNDQLDPPLYNEFELVNGQESIIWR